MNIACGGEAAGGRPGPARRIVEFRARESAAVAVSTACDEHLAVGQQRRRVTRACGGEAAGGRPSPALTRARLHEHQPGTEQKQRERDPPRKNQAGRPETGDQSVKAVSAAVWPARADSSGTPRWRENFNAGWRFRRQAHGGGALGSFDRNATMGADVESAFREAHLPEYADSAWDRVNLPHTWNAHDGSDSVPGYFRGIGWYRKHFTVPDELRGKRAVLEVEGANQVAEFWLNGARARHEGGYTSFELDMTEHVRFGAARNVLAVKVDNLYNPHIRQPLKPT